MMAASNIHYEVAQRSRGLGCGGIGAMHLLARRTGLIEAIDRRLHLLKVHLPYHESDHVLNVAYNILAGGTCLQDIELQRNQEAYLDALGAQRIPDPTTEGDFCRRFKVPHIETLMAAINQVRLGVWKLQPAEFFERGVIDGGGHGRVVAKDADVRPAQLPDPLDEVVREAVVVVDDDDHEGIVAVRRNQFNGHGRQA
jgi:hypothetical protein